MNAINKRIMKKRKIILIITVAILLANIPLISWILDANFQNGYDYSNGDGTFTRNFCSDFTCKESPDFMNLSLYKKVYENDTEPLGITLRKLYFKADTVIYRLFWKNPLCCWHWGQYISGDHKYDFPYKSWGEIKDRRPKDFKLNSQWQQF